MRYFTLILLFNFILFASLPKGATKYDSLSVSNISLKIYNNGMIGDWENTDFFVPKGSVNSYINGSGFIITGDKRIGDDTETQFSYSFDFKRNSVFSPLEDRIYNSKDYDKITGKSFIDSTYWPLWKHNTNKEYEERSVYEKIPNLRNYYQYKAGPSFFSENDFVWIMNDQNLENYPVELLNSSFRPLGVEVVQRISSWSSDTLENTIIQVFDIKNISGDILLDMTFSYIIDYEICAGTENDSCRWNDRAYPFPIDRNVHILAAYSDPQYREWSNTGYFGLNFVESPIVDSLGYIIEENPKERINEQSGFRNLDMISEMQVPELEYSIYPDLIKGGNPYFNKIAWGIAPSDHWSIFATRFFNLLPNQSTRIAISFTVDKIDDPVTGEMEQIIGAPTETPDYSNLPFYFTSRLFSW